ncbi:tRNA pseudouridine(38-40) synthase TruA [Gilvibacter sediminis]|uniref:tRNA pseudouridine(38-40) synthase TruA n=1 Tax=Gilvibacter sediminis TaxID=379071 RepID=UPI002350864A|nr:tRNA pseudouridine(38-40) synthase TruA [Gilvibacter sediminis]MDC7999396.1 tRNA pseudouridine(38-40) synthase TruA [Gilvibacter sediminis]
MRYFLEIAFDGTDFHGWQRQPNAISVQEALEEALRLVCKIDSGIVGAGRTDTGVHAVQIMAHVDADFALDQDPWLDKLNSFLPPSIVIKSIRQVQDDAHARFQATGRTYKYYISLGKNPFAVQFSHSLHRTPDVAAMNEGAKLLLGTQDFQCFSRSNTDVKTYVCDLKEAYWVQEGQQLVFTISADRFLRNMVRAVVGTLLEVGYGKRAIDSIPQLIASKNRSEAGASAPAKGLFLHKVSYPEALYKS